MSEEKYRVDDKLTKSLDRHDMIPFLRGSKDPRFWRKQSGEYGWDQVGFPISAYNEKVHKSKSIPFRGK